MEIRTMKGFVAEVAGLDITAGDLEEHGEALRSAIDEHGVMVVRDTAQDDEAYVRYASLFGELQRSTAKLRDPDFQGDDRLVDISNVAGDGEIAAADSIQRTIMLGARLWHTDNSFRNPPTRYTMLAELRVATEGGDTQFRDMRAAYEALPDELRERIDRLVAIHDFEFSRKLSNGPEMTAEEKASLPPVEHPLVREHPVTGTRAIYDGSHACQIAGMDIDEGQRLLVDLHERALDESIIYTHKWRPGDILMWDNRSVQHRQLPYPDNDIKRVMRRATVADEPTRVPAGV